MIKYLQQKMSWAYHPVTVFLAIQILWVLVMVVWVRWYIEKQGELRQMAEQIRTQAAIEGFTWMPLLVGAILLTLIIAGATVIFIYWNKQHRLNQMQRIFVSNVTHELKSPVASIQLALETMTIRELSQEKRREFLEMMLDDTHRLATLIDRILGAARIEKRRSHYNIEPVSLRRFIEEALQQDRHIFEKDGHVVILEKGPEVRAAIDRSAMHMVLRNLVENAVRYSPKGSTVRLRLHHDLRSCRIDVSDSGEGIPRKNLKNIFKMFWRGGIIQWTRPGGTGLGLYIVRNIVGDHGGKVWATSPGPGRGSTFSVRLPRLRRPWSFKERKKLRAQNASRQ
jgi:signal transduction histidine kinase